MSGIKLIGSLVVELIDSIAAFTLVITVALTIGWAFMPDGFWASKLKYFWLASAVALTWTFFPLIVGIVKAIYLDWKEST